MDSTPEKHPQTAPSDPESPVSPISDPSTDTSPANHSTNTQETAQTPNTWASLPKRKPLPLPAQFTTPNTDSDPTKTSQQPISPEPSKSKSKLAALATGFATLASLDWYRYSSRKRKRNFLILGAIAILLLLALIIGLAVGLTVGKKNKNSSVSNLALPTSHGGPYSGDLTYYNPAMGSCGWTNSDSDYICAVSHVLFDAASTGSNPNENPLCGMKLRLRRDGTSVDVRVVDRCVGCKETDLDVTEAVFEEVAELGLGRVNVEWSWLEEVAVDVS